MCGSTTRRCGSRRGVPMKPSPPARRHQDDRGLTQRLDAVGNELAAHMLQKRRRFPPRRSCREAAKVPSSCRDPACERQKGPASLHRGKHPCVFFLPRVPTCERSEPTDSQRLGWLALTHPDARRERKELTGNPRRTQGTLRVIESSHPHPGWEASVVSP
jgi:hypothetical protein